MSVVQELLQPMSLVMVQDQTNLNPNSSHMPYPVPSIRTRHQSDKIDPHHIRVDFMFVHVHICGTLKCTTLHNTESIEWVSMRLVPTIAHLYKYPRITVSCNDIYLSAFYLIVTLHKRIALILEVLYNNILSNISDATTWLYHIHKYIFFIWYVQQRHKKRAFLLFFIKYIT